MTYFTSHKERRLWLVALAAILAIYLTAVIARPVAGFLRENGLLEATFAVGMALVVLTLITQQARARAGWGELGVWFGLAAVYLLLFVRMEIPEERTHLIEYGVLAAFIYQALSERGRNGRKVPMPALLTVVVVALLGALDECLQYIIPGRVFDVRDIGFNALAGVIAVSAAVALDWAGRKRQS